MKIVKFFAIVVSAASVALAATIEKRADTVTFKLDKAITEPVCNVPYKAVLTVRVAPAVPARLASCQKIVEWIGGDKGSLDVDVVFSCDGEPGQSIGPDISRNKVILQIAPLQQFKNPPRPVGDDHMPALLKTMNLVTGYYQSEFVQLGFIIDSKDKPVFQLIYCG